MTSELDSRSLIPEMPKNDEYSLVMTHTMQSGWRHYLYYAYVFMRWCICLLTYTITSVFGDWPVI